MPHAGTRGWGNPDTADYRKKIVPIYVDNVKFFVHKDVAPILDHFLSRLVLENSYSLDETKDDWSYVLRPIRGYEDEYEHTGDMKYLSNHSWGLAIDVNATKNPMSRTLRTDLPVAWVRANVARYGLGWGGDWSGRKDPMHFEFLGTPKQARSIVDSLNSEQEDELTPEEKKMLKEVHQMLTELGAPRRPDRTDINTMRINLGDVYTLVEKRFPAQ